MNEKKELHRHFLGLYVASPAMVAKPYCVALYEVTYSDGSVATVHGKAIYPEGRQHEFDAFASLFAKFKDDAESFEKINAGK